MIRFACPSCSATFTVTDDKAGKTSSCPKCKGQFVIPGEVPPPKSKPVPKLPATAPVAIRPCPKCRTQLSVEPADLGTDVECPTCDTVFRARKPGTGSQAKLPPLDDDEPVRRRSRVEDDDDDRPRRMSRRNDDEDDDEADDDDRPRTSRRDERPRRKLRRHRRSSGGDGLRISSSILGFVIAALDIVCGIGLLFIGGTVADLIMGAGAKAPGNRANVGQVAAIGSGAFIGCGLGMALLGILYIIGAIGLLQKRTYGKIITIITAVISSILGLFALYGFLMGLGGPVLATLFGMISVGIYVGHSVTSFMACFGAGGQDYT